MALVKLIPNVDRLRGRVGKGAGAMVYYRVGNQDIARSRGVIRDPKTPLQTLHRAIRSALAKRYADLPLERREAWDRLAERIREDANRNGSVERIHKNTNGNGSAFYKGGQAFQAVNAHHCLAGFEAADDPPEYCRVAAPLKAAGAAALTDGRLRLVIEHIVSAGAGYWRVRLTPPLGTGGRRAQPSELRLATLEPAHAYFPILASPQTIEFQPRFTYRTGENLGLEIMALSPGFIPGEALILRHVSIEME